MKGEAEKVYARCQRQNKYLTIADRDRPWRHWIQSVLHKVRCWFDPPTAIGRCMVFVNIVTNQRVLNIVIVAIVIDCILHRGSRLASSMRGEADLQVVVACSHNCWTTTYTAVTRIR